MTTTTMDVPTVHLPAKGELFRCEECGMEIEVLEECQCENGVPRLECCDRPLRSAGLSFSAKTKEAFVEQMQAGMAKTKETVARLKAKADHAKDSMKEELNRETEALSEHQEKLSDSLHEVKAASGDAWRDLAKGCSESWQRFREACSDAVSRYRS